MDKLTLWLVGAGAVWIIVGYLIWLGFCWAEGTDHPNTEAMHVMWPVFIVCAIFLGLFLGITWPFRKAHEKMVKELVRRGRERKQAGIANESPGRVIPNS